MGYKENLVNLDDYLAEMGWDLSKDGLQYAWLKQLRNKQAEITWSIAEKAGQESVREEWNDAMDLGLREAYKAGRKEVVDWIKTHKSTLKVNGYPLLKNAYVIGETDLQAFLKEEEKPLPSEGEK